MASSSDDRTSRQRSKNNQKAYSILVLSLLTLGRGIFEISWWPEHDSSFRNATLSSWIQGVDRYVGCKCPESKSSFEQQCHYATSYARMDGHAAWLKCVGRLREHGVRLPPLTRTTTIGFSINWNRWSLHSLTVNQHGIGTNMFYLKVIQFTFLC